MRTILIQTLVISLCQSSKYLKEERNRKARENYQKRKEALNEPIVMPEESKELSEYEKIREMNFKERNEALAEAGFDWKPSCI